MDAELCVVNLCQPELDSDMQALISRLTRLEDQIQTGSFMPQPLPVQETVAPKPTDAPAIEPKVIAETTEVKKEIVDEAPVGFWSDVAAAVRAELNPAMRGFFATTPNAPLLGILAGERLVLACANKYIMDIVNKPEISELIARKASAKIGRPVRVVFSDSTGAEEKNEQMEQLLNFGRSHGDIVKITEE